MVSRGTESSSTSAVNPRGHPTGSVGEDKLSFRHPHGKHRANPGGYFYRNHPRRVTGVVGTNLTLAGALPYHHTLHES